VSKQCVGVFDVSDEFAAALSLHGTHLMLSGTRSFQSAATLRLNTDENQIKIVSKQKLIVKTVSGFEAVEGRACLGSDSNKKEPLWATAASSKT
jgi:hypothetical protein